MKAEDIKPGFDLAFIQSVGANAIKLFEADPQKNREAFGNALHFVQGMLVPPTVTRAVSTVLDKVKQEFPVTFTHEGGEAHMAISELAASLHAAKVVIDESATRMNPQDRAANKSKGKLIAVAGQAVWTMDPAAVIAKAKGIFGLT